MMVNPGCTPYVKEGGPATEPVQKPIKGGTSDVVGFHTFNVYTEEKAKDNHFVPSGWMGDVEYIEVDQGSLRNPHSGRTCLKISYIPMAAGKGWAGIYWQNPANNWGEVDGGFDLRGAVRLTFWARGKSGGEVCEFKIGGIKGAYPDSDSATTGPVTLTSAWKMYSIDLTLKDLSYISGGFCWVAKASDNPEGCILYLDDIRYE